MSAEPNPATDLAVERTRIAHDRTLMAWIRTSASLISFGFTIYKFFDYLRGKGELQAERRFGPREFALMLIAIGLAALLIGAVENRRAMVTLRKHYAHVPYSMATLVAALLALLGLITFIAVVFQL
jgi:putative membrane protein